MNQEKIGKFIAECRKKKKLTQEQLAERLGITYKAVSKWECGKGLPDISIMLELCDILEISLNELFAGEVLSDIEVKKQSEKNIIDILKFGTYKDRKNKIIILFILILFFISLFFVGRFFLIKNGYVIDNDLKYSQIYISDEENIKGDVDINKFGKINIDFDIGANKYGFAVFKNPYRAFRRLKKDYKDGIKLIKKEFRLLPLSNFNYKSYKTYGWQVTGGSDRAREQARFVSSFMDIYENSFRTSLVFSKSSYNEGELLFSISKIMDCVPVSLSVFDNGRYELSTSYAECFPGKTCTMMLKYTKFESGKYDYDVLKIIDDSINNDSGTAPIYEILIGDSILEGYDEYQYEISANKYLDEFLESIGVNLDACAKPDYFK